MFKADWFIKTLLYNLDPKITCLMKDYKSFVEISFSYEEAKALRKRNSMSTTANNNNNINDEIEESEYESVTATDTRELTREQTETRDDTLVDDDDEEEDDQDSNVVLSKKTEEWHRLWIVVSSLDKTIDKQKETQSMWLEKVHFKIKIKRLNVTEDGDLKDTESDDESPVLKQFIDNVNQNMDMLQLNSNLLKNLSNVYRSLMFAKFIYENNVPINVDLIKQIVLKQKIELKNDNLDFTLPAFKASYQQSVENTIRQTMVTREMFFEGGIEFAVKKESDLVISKNEKQTNETIEKLDSILSLKQKNTKAKDIVLNLSNKNHSNDNIIKQERMKAILKHFMIESFPMRLLLNNKNKNKNSKNNKYKCAYNGCKISTAWKKPMVYEENSYCEKHYEMMRYSTCHKCKKKMDGCKDTWATIDNESKNEMENSNLNFHDECFRCYQCDKLLTRKSFEFEQQTLSVFCSLECLHRSHNENESNRFIECYKCKKTIDKWTTNENLTGIKDNEYIFHTECFSCYQCNKRLTAFYEFETVIDNKEKETENVQPPKDKDKDTDKHEEQQGKTKKKKKEEIQAQKQNSKEKANENNRHNKNEEKEQESNNNNNKPEMHKELTLFCSLECKYENDGKAGNDRFTQCYYCDQSIDKWKVDEDLITVNSINDGEIILHRKCFVCIQCKKPLDSYFEFPNNEAMNNDIDVSNGKNGKVDSNNSDKNENMKGKKALLVCSVECKHRYDGDSEDTRFVDCAKCKKKMDIWVDTQAMMIHEGQVVFHHSCFNCFTCDKPLATFYEWNIIDEKDKQRNGQLYLFCSLECHPQKEILARFWD